MSYKNLIHKKKIFWIIIFYLFDIHEKTLVLHMRVKMFVLKNFHPSIPKTFLVIYFSNWSNNKKSWKFSSLGFEKKIS